MVAVGELLMSNVLLANEVFAKAAALFASGEAPQAVTLLDRLAEQHPNDWALQRRVLSATGGCQIDAGLWRNAADRLERAKAFAAQLGDPTAELSVLVNQTSLYMATWQYRAVVEATETIEMFEHDGHIQRQEKAAALINRAHAALLLGEFDIAERAAATAYSALNTIFAATQHVNLIHLAAAGHCRVRVMLARHDLNAARTTITQLERLPLAERAMVHLLLAHAATLAAMGFHDPARAMLHRLLDAKVPDGLRRDAMFALLNVEQQAGNISETLRLLTQLSDLVVAHRASVLEDALDIHELTDGALSAAAAMPAGTHTPKSPLKIEAAFASMSRIIEASESAAAFRRRLRAAGLSALFALHCEHGTRFACAIARGVIMRDCGSLSMGTVPDQSAAFANAALRSTLGIFDRIGLDRTALEYRIAAFRYECFDGSGLLGVSARDTPLEAQIASLCWRAACELATAPSHCASASLIASFDRWILSVGVQVLDPWIDRLEIAHFRDNSLPIDIVAAVTAH